MIKKRINRICCEDPSLIENYELAINDEERIWICHHRLEIQEDGTILSTKQLKEQGLYFHRPANELIFMTLEEHSSLTARNISNDTRELLKKRTGENNGFYGHKHTEETKMKISLANKGRKDTEETKKRKSEASKKMLTPEMRKRISEKLKGRPSPNKGKKLTPEMRKRISEKLKGRPRPNKGRPSPNKGRKRVVDENGKIRYIKPEQMSSVELF